jgi:hypothetical protein
MPWSRSIIIFSSNTTKAQIRSSLDSCLWLRFGLAIALSSAKNVSDTTHHIKAFAPKKLFFLIQDYLIGVS